MANTSSDDLFPEVRNPEGTCFINGRCRVLTRDNRRVVLVSGIPIAQYAPDDRMSEAQAMVSLIELGWADQNDVANTFGYSARTLRRYQQRFAEGGLAALGRPSGYPPGLARLAAARRKRIQIRWAVWRCLRGALRSASRISSMNAIAANSFGRSRSGTFRSAGTALTSACRTARR